MTSDIPQGSVLGPLLFVMFLNDLPKTVQCGIKLFADDTKVYVRSDIPCDITMHIELTDSFATVRPTGLKQGRTVYILCRFLFLLGIDLVMKNVVNKGRSGIRS